MAGGDEDRAQRAITGDVTDGLGDMACAPLYAPLMYGVGHGLALRPLQRIQHNGDAGDGWDRTAPAALMIIERIDSMDIEERRWSGAVPAVTGRWW